MKLRCFLLLIAFCLALDAGPLQAQQRLALIADFNPKVGAPGDRVIITGSGFMSGHITIRFWNSVPAAIYTNSDSQITATVPAGATTGPLSLQKDADDPSYTSADFTVIGPGPYIASFAPTFADTNMLVLISGAHFAGTALNGVKFNGKPTTDATVNADGTSISARVPYGATSGPITVTSATGTSNSAAPFTVVGPGPYISGFSPAMGDSGQTVLISGLNFTGATNAMFNGVRGVNFAVQSDTQIRVNAPTNVTTGPISVRGPKGVIVTSSNFFAPPTISSLTPGTGRAGTNVTIKGRNLAGAVSVTFNGVAVGTYSATNNTNLVVSAPAGAPSGVVRVTTPAYSAFSVTNFKFLPTVTGFSPGFGPAGTPVTISGANLNEGSPTVRFNGVLVPAGSVSGVSYGQLTAQVPSGVTSGLISITTTNGAHTNVSNFYLPCVISSFAPSNSAPGTVVSIKGVNFLGASAVTFSGVAAESTVVNNTNLQATVPAGVISGPISVATPANTAASTALFYGAPLITGYSPNHGLPGTAVILTGTNFLGASAVRFNGRDAAFTVNHNGQVTATVPAGAQNGPIMLVAPAGTNQAPGIFSLDYTSDLALTAGGAPDTVPVGSNVVYTIAIQNKGPSDAPNVRLTNTLSSLAVLQASTLSQGTLDASTNPITANLGTLPNGSFAFVTLTLSAPVAETLTDAVTVTSDFADPQPSDNLTAVTTTILPYLSIRRASTNRVALIWPTNFGHFTLEAKGAFDTNYYWSNVVATPAIVNTNNLVTDTNADPGKFYRLRR